MSRNYQIRMPQPLPRWMMNRWKKMTQLNQPPVKHLETYRNVVWQLKQPPLRQVETHHEGDAAGDPDAMDEGDPQSETLPLGSVHRGGCFEDRNL